MSVQKILFLDIYREEEYRLNKDVNGGYGTGNNYASGSFTKLLAKYQKNNIFWPPLYLVSTIAVLKNKGYYCQYSTDLKESNEDFDIFILSSSIVACETEVSATNYLRKFGKPILVLGPFASNNPDKYLDAGASVIIGESDTGLFEKPEIINSLTVTPQKIATSGINVDINSLPTPDWEEVFRHKKPIMGFLGTGPSIALSTSRGCPYSCFNYCTYPLQQGRKHRLESIHRIADQIEYFQKKLGVKSILFRDPVFTLNRDHVVKLCREIKHRKLKIVWGAELHLKDIDKELAKLMFEAGLRIVFVGIESINPESIKKSRRQNAPIDQQLRGIKFLEEAGVSVKAMFIIAFPGDNFKNAIETIKYALMLPVTYLQFSVFTPYPGTPIFLEYRDKIIAKNFEEYSQWDLVFKHENLSQSDVKYLLSKAYSAFYKSPVNLARILYRLIKIELRKRIGIF